MQKKYTFRRSIWLLPISILALTLIGFIFSFYIHRIDFALRALDIVVPALIASLVLVLLFGVEVNLTEKIVGFELNQKRLTTFYIILFIVSVLSLLVFSDHTWIYFLIMTAISVIILIQILSPNVSPNIVLVEIILALLNNIYAITLTKPLYFGYNDILLHLRIADVIYLSGHTIPIDYVLEYVNFPLYHIFIVEGSLLSNLGLQNALFISTALVFVTVVVILYHIFNKAMDNKIISLLACLSFAFSSTTIFYGAYMVTRVMAFVGFLYMLYFLYSNDQYNGDNPKELEKVRNKNIIFNGLAVLIALFIILVHQVSVYQISILLLILMICEWATRKFNKLNIYYIRYKFYILFNVMFATYWLYFASGFTSYLFQSKFNVDNFDGGLTMAKTSVRDSIVSSLINNISISFFLFFALVGIGYFVWRMRGSQKYAIAICLFALAAMLFYVPNPIMTLWQTVSLFRFDRFVLLVSPFMAFVMGLGIFILYRYLNDIKVPAVICITVIALLFGGYTLFSTNIIGTSQNDARDYFLNGELASFDFVQANVPYNSMLYSDGNGIRYFDGLQNFSETAALGLPYYRIDPFPVDNISQVRGYKILRYKELQDHGLYVGSTNGDQYDIYAPEDKYNLTMAMQSNNKIYSDYDTDIYI